MTDDDTQSPSAEKGKWFKSSFSGGSDCCVEVVFEQDAIRVRDSKYPRDQSSNAGDEPVLSFTEAEWGAFVAGVKAGEFDGSVPIPQS